MFNGRKRLPYFSVALKVLCILCPIQAAYADTFIPIVSDWRSTVDVATIDNQGGIVFIGKQGEEPALGRRQSLIYAVEIP